MTDNNFFDVSGLDKEIAEQTRLESGYVQLPFDVLSFAWLRGELRYNKEQSPVGHYGGWSQDVKYLSPGISSLPQQFKRETLVNSKGKSYEAITVRSIAVAVIAVRKGWIYDRRKGHELGKIQALCYSAIRQEDGSYIPFMPVVLAASSNAGVSLEKAIKGFGDVTHLARTKIANGLLPGMFFCHLGTFGKERVQSEVGKIQKNWITPVQCWPTAAYMSDDKRAREYLHGAFVGKDMAQEMSMLATLAREWLDDWSRETIEKRNEELRKLGPLVEQSGGGGGGGYSNSSAVDDTGTPF